MLLIFWRQSPTATQQTGHLRIGAAVASKLADSIPELAEATWADRFPPDRGLPRCRVSPLGRNSTAIGRHAKIEVETIQVSLYHDDPDSIDDLAERIDACLDGASLTLTPGPRNQAFFQCRYVSGPMSTTEKDRETQAQIVYGRIFTYAISIDVASVGRQRSNP